MRRRAATLARACHAGARTPGGGRVLIGRGLVLLAGLLCALVAAAVAAGRGGTDALHAHRPTIWVPDGVLDHLLARETALARPNMPLLDRFFAPSFP